MAPMQPDTCALRLSTILLALALVHGASPRSLSSCMRSSTTLRRFRAASGCLNGSYVSGDCTMPASRAACGSVSLAAGTLKYVCAAASMP